jgi:excisionase family DNA binding protein
MAQATVEQIARKYGVSRRTVYRKVATGELPAYRFGRQLRFDEAEVSAAMRLTVPGATAAIPGDA